MARPTVRNALNNAWVDVFCKGGWKMKMPDGSFLTLTPLNFKMRNPQNTGWLDFYCPIAPPKNVTGGKIRANKLVDTAGFLWGAGYTDTGLYEDKTNLSKTWQKIKYRDLSDYVNNIKFMDSYGTTFMITNDNKVLVSGSYTYGNWANGYQSGNSVDYGTILDVTAEWEKAIGVGMIPTLANLDASGLLLTKDGVPFVVGKDSLIYTAPFRGATSNSEYGSTGAGGNPFIAAGIDSRMSLVTRWKRLQYSSDRTNSSVLSGIIAVAKTANNWSFALRDDGKLLQAPLWYTSGSAQYTYPNGFPVPKGRYDSMFDTLPFTESTPVNLHSGAIMEAANGNLYYPSRKYHGGVDYFYDFEWINTGINVNSLGAKCIRIVGIVTQVSDYGGPKVTVFILLEDGRLYASGENASGWMGIGSATKTVTLNTPRLINTNVVDFDSVNDATLAMKKDGTLWGCGYNGSSYLGLGPDLTAYNIYDWQRCIFTSI